MNALLISLVILASHANAGGGDDSPPPCYENDGHLKIGSNCVSCPSGCKTCFGSAYWYQCSSCYSGYYLQNTLCLPKNPSALTLFKFNSQINLGMDLTGIFQIGSNNTNKYPNYDANDPYPTYQRGYYFTTNSYMVSDTFNLSPWFTSSFWIKPYSTGTIFIKRNANNIKLNLYISSSKDLVFTMNLNSGYSLFLKSKLDTADLSTWNQIGIVCDLDTNSWHTKIELIHNGIAVAQSTASTADWYNDPTTAFIGNDYVVSQTLTAFIYSLNHDPDQTHGLDDYYTTPNCTSECSICSGDFTCPDNCDFGQFYENGVCVDCLSECTYGCRTGERCNICETKECYSCNDAFVCNTCVTRGNLTDNACECNLNSFFNETTKICDICDNGYCSQCLTINYFDCKVCEPNYELIETICLKHAPINWNPQKAKPYMVLDIPFYNTYQGEYGIFKTGTNETTYYPFNDPELMDPVPIENRGLYFSNGTFLNSSQILLPYFFTMIICINPKNGDFFEKGSLSINSNGKASIILEDPLNNLMHIVTHSDFQLENWTFFTLIVSYFNSTTTLSTYSNGNLLFLYSYYPWVFRDTDYSSMAVGKSQESIFDGFIYSYQLFIGEINDIVSYIENKEILNQLPQCDYDYTFDQNNTCISCNSSCTIGCIREQNCNLCYDQLCRNCSGPLEASTCFNCAELAHNLYPNECICDDDAFLIKNDSNWYCEHCDYNYCAFCDDNGHFECKGCRSGVLIDTVCLDEYPIGYEKCFGINCLITEIYPTQYFTGLYGIFIGGLLKKCFPHFNETEKEDPIPVDRRGFYLDGVSKFFQTENETYLGHIFSIGGWFSVLGAGDILEHSNRLLLTSNGSLSITLQDRDQKEFPFATPGISFSGWNYLSYTIFYANSTTSLNVFLNNDIVFQKSFRNLLFRDISNSTIFLGKSQNSFFHGFIYNFKMWNFEKKDFNYEFKNEICGYGKNGTCLTLCKIDEFYQEWEGSEPSCEKCLRSCDKGCIRKDTCNICHDVLCAVCPYFGPTFCTKCVPFAYGSAKCQCMEEYVLSLDRLSCIRFPYENSPEKYWIHFLPNTTIIVGKWSDNFVINTIHPWMIDAHLVENDIVTFNSYACTFSPFYENYTCSFNVLVDPSYDNKNGPITINVKFQGYTYQITFPVSYDDFSLSLMNYPERLGVVFYSGYNYIQILPNGDISFNNELCSDENCTHVDCEKLLTKNSISLIGGNIDCTYSGPNIISIYVGHIKDKVSSLIFREKVFHLSANETNLKHLDITWRLQKPPLPVASITPVIEVCCSCIVTFDGSGSSTKLGSLNYQWIFPDYMRYSGNTTERMPNITFQSCNNAKDHPQFNVTLKVTDNFDQEESATITVNMTSDDVAIYGWKDPNIKAITDEVSKLIFKYHQSSKIYLEPNPLVIWSLYKKPSSRMLLGSKVYESSGLEFVYKFTQKGEYIIVLDAYFNNKTYKISANASIIATPPAPNLVLHGVNTFVYLNSLITVNLTASYNGEIIELDKGYAFINVLECSNGNFIEMKGDVFKLNVINKERMFNCSFTVGLRDYPDFESEVSWLYAVKGNIPRVYIVSMFPYLDPTSPVRLVANVADSLRMDISWREKKGHPFIATTLKNQPSITIKEFSMLCGIDYEFEITVIDPVSFVPVKASIKRYVNCPPNSGTFEVNPKEGIALNTQFNVLFAGWSDLESNDPITYQVFMQNGEDMIALTPKSDENKFQIVLGERGKIKLVGRIYDSRGTFNEVELLVDVNDSSFVDAKEKSEILLNSGIETMDSHMLFSSIHSTAQYAFHNTLRSDELGECIENLAGTLNKWMNSSMPRIGLSSSSAVIDAVNTLLGKAEEYKEKLLLEIYDAQNKALNHTMTLDIYTYRKILSNLDSLLDNLQSLSIQNESAHTEMDLFKMINKTYSEGSLKYLQNINPNEGPVKHNGVKFNSTNLAVDGNTLAKPIEYDSPINGSTANFNVVTSKNPDSTTYLVSILSISPFKNISDIRLDSASSYLVSSESYSFDEGTGTSYGVVETKKYIYSDEIISSFVQSSLTKNNGTIINPNLYEEEVNKISSEVSYEIFDNDLKPTCTVYDMNIEKASFRFCQTVLGDHGVASCFCDIAGLFGVMPYPTIASVLTSRIEEFKNFGIPTTDSVPAFVIFVIMILLYILGWIDSNKLDIFYGAVEKENALNANNIVLEEIDNYLIEEPEQKFINAGKNLNDLLDLWKLEKNSYDEDKVSEDGIYYILRDKLKIKLKFQFNNEITNALLTVENIRGYLENCIDIRRWKSIKNVIDILLKLDSSFVEESKILCKNSEKLWLSTIKRILFRRWKPITEKIICAIEVALECKKITGDQSLKERLKKTNLDPENLDIYKNIQLDNNISNTELIHSIKGWKDAILIYLREKIDHLAYNDSNASDSARTNNLKKKIDDSPNDNLEEINEDTIKIASKVERPQEKKLTEFSTFWTTALIEIQNEQITSMNYKEKEFFGYFIKNNEILGVIGYTDLNFPRVLRFTYLMLAISMEVTIAISAFDNYNKQIEKEFFIIQEQTLYMIILSLCFGTIPKILKPLFNYNILNCQFEKNKIANPRQRKVIIGYALSLAIFIAEWIYCISKLRSFPLTNIYAYLSYIAQSLMIFMGMSGIVLPLLLACFDYCGCFKGLDKRLKTYCKRLFCITNNSVAPTTPYQNDGRQI